MFVKENLQDTARVHGTCEPNHAPFISTINDNTNSHTESKRCTDLVFEPRVEVVEYAVDDGAYFCLAPRDEGCLDLDEPARVCKTVEKQSKSIRASSSGSDMSTYSQAGRDSRQTSKTANR